jgi:hypothetical protein
MSELISPISSARLRNWFKEQGPKMSAVQVKAKVDSYLFKEKVKSERVRERERGKERSIKQLNERVYFESKASAGRNTKV